jgi:hypothetical protein
MKGGIYVRREVALSGFRKWLQRPPKNNHLPRSANALEALSNREMHIFQLLGSGLGTTNIAQLLSLSVKTVHRKRFSTISRNRADEVLGNHRWESQETRLELVLFSAIDSKGRPIWIVDAHRGDGKRFIVHADDKLTAFMELDSATRAYRELI